MKKLLTEICNPKQWKTISTTNLLNDGYIVYGANGPIGFYNQYTHEKPTLMITCRGATCGTLNISKPFSYINGNAMALDDLSEEVNIKYLYYYLNNRGLGDTISGSAQPQITKLGLSKVEIEYPSIKIQKQIVNILDKAQELIDKRKEQIQYLDELIKSKFIEMFGDPIDNPFNWKLKAFLDSGSCKNGMNFSAGETGVELQYLGVGDFKNLSKIDNVNNLGKINLNKMPSKEYLLENGDIIFVRSNGNKSLVGRCLAVYPNGIPTTYSGFCIRYRKTNDELEIPYLLQVLKTDSIRKRMAGRGANIQNLNQQILGNLMIPIPPLEIQKQFSDFVNQVDKLKYIFEISLKELENNFNSLMQKAFKGNLFM